MMKHFIILGIFLFFSTNVFAKDFYRYFAFGEATGTYEEKRFDLDEDIDSTSYVYGNLYFPKKDLLSSTVFAQLTQFSLDVKDTGQRRHELDVLLLGLNWGRGLAGTIDVGDSNIVLDASAFLGAGLIRASKKITNSDSTLHSDFPEAYGANWGYGTMLTFAFIYDGTWTIGVRNLYQNDRIHLDYDGESGTLIQENTVELFLGYASSPEPACVETRFSPCL